VLRKRAKFAGSTTQGGEKAKSSNLGHTKGPVKLEKRNGGGKAKKKTRSGLGSRTNYGNIQIRGSVSLHCKEKPGGASRRG